MAGNWPTSAFTLVKIPAPQAFVIDEGRFAEGIWTSMKAAIVSRKETVHFGHDLANLDCAACMASVSISSAL
jgi:hypothetical protein